MPQVATASSWPPFGRPRDAWRPRFFDEIAHAAEARALLYPRATLKEAPMSELTSKILIQIRDEIRATNERLDRTNERLEQTNERLEQTNERLEQTSQRLEARTEVIIERFDALDARLATHEKILVRLTDVTVDGFAAIEKRLDNLLTGEHRNAHVDDRRRVDEIDARLTKVERKLRRHG
jgi:hypothetical protein